VPKVVSPALEKEKSPEKAQPNNSSRTYCRGKSSFDYGQLGNTGCRYEFSYGAGLGKGDELLAAK
jgi:hypothetical protein